jgi:hypothetical protein
VVYPVYFLDPYNHHPPASSSVCYNRLTAIMVNVLLFAAALNTAVAMPALMNDPVARRKALDLIERKSANIVRAATATVAFQDALGISKAQDNCGPSVCDTFDGEDQFVTVSADHAYASPGPGDIRGPCPG